MIIKCKNWEPSERFFRGVCKAGKYDGIPSLGHCIDICKECDNTREELDDYIKTLPKVSNTQQIKNAGKAVKRAIKSKCKKVSKKEQERRWQICLKCPQLSDILLKTCKQCGCSLKLKTRLESEHCPIDKW